VKKKSVRRARAFSLARLVLSVALLVVPPTLAFAALRTWLEYESIEDTLLAKFDGERWEVQAKIFSDSFSVYPGLRVDTDAFRQRLERLDYQRVNDSPSRRGSYHFSKQPHTLELWLHAFQYSSGEEPGRKLRMELDDLGRVIEIVEVAGGKEIDDFSLEPALLSGVATRPVEDRRVLRLDEFPPLLVRSVLAIEDRRFFEHYGVDVRSLARAVAVNAVSGEVRQGGSTLTQQLMKNFFLTDERTASRKLREAAMALVAERRFSKGEILENYLNEIWLGQSGARAIHGMGEAARFYFGRDVGDLSLAQTATLAGIIRAPSFYSPHRHPERAQSRRDLVLAELFEQGDIDQAQYESALNEPMQTASPDSGGLRAPYFVDYVARELGKRYPRRVLDSEGYRVFTTLDPEMQAIADSVVAANVHEMETDIAEAVAEAGQPLRAALIAIEPRTGKVRAMVGGRDYGMSQFNRAIDMRRQPGSTFKPIVMLAALGGERVGARHFKPTTTVIDERIQWEWKGQVWSPRNYEGEFYGPVTVREALEHSLNSATASIARDVGVQPIRDLAVRLGMTPDLGVYPSIVLGGQAVPLLDMAKVFSVLAAGGMRATPLSVRRVVSGDGRVVEGNEVEIRRVVPAADAYLVTHLMEGVMERGTGATARSKGFKHPAAGKTGTSNDYKDAWFVGFTPDLLVAVWVGFDEAASMERAGSEAALPIWIDFMRQALADHPHTSFDIPPGIQIIDIDKKTGEIARPDCPKQVREAFLDGEQPAEYCHEHGGFWH